MPTTTGDDHAFGLNIYPELPYFTQGELVTVTFIAHTKSHKIHRTPIRTKKRKETITQIKNNNNNNNPTS